MAKATPVSTGVALREHSTSTGENWTVIAYRDAVGSTDNLQSFSGKRLSIRVKGRE